MARQPPILTKAPQGWSKETSPVGEPAGAIEVEKAALVQEDTSDAMTFYGPRSTHPKTKLLPIKFGVSYPPAGSVDLGYYAD